MQLLRLPGGRNEAVAIHSSCTFAARANDQLCVPEHIMVLEASGEHRDINFKDTSSSQHQRPLDRNQSRQCRGTLQSAVVHEATAPPRPHYFCASRRRPQTCFPVPVLCSPHSVGLVRLCIALAVGFKILLAVSRAAALVIVLTTSS